MSDRTFTKTQFDGNAGRSSRHPEASFASHPEPRRGEGSLAQDRLRAEGSPCFEILRCAQNDVDVAVLLSRSILYQALSFFFRRPDLAQDLSLVDKTRGIWQAAVDTLPFHNRDRLRGLLDALLGRLKNTTPKEWAEEYEKLLGHTVKGVASAYELEYGEEHTHREPHQLADITAFYSAFGLKLSNRSHERADHASVELEFMYFLLYKEILALEDGKEEKAQISMEASRHFLSEHLSYWFPAFSLRVSKYSKGLLKGIADFAFEFVVQDCLAQNIKPGSQDLPLRAVQEKIEAACVSCEFARPVASMEFS
ncbi:MAG: hypothetical protein A3G87_07140 [Omnitrophica bacterium RIFCSPLOWO2_12_FULL_50_11]|nr:MAG: hypothetical protein A3G87_07140 [Omnitrophica bacterium RIFCSPLOWO2_12_FULL_50_11]